MDGFDVERFTKRGFGGHGGALGLIYHARGDGWVELALPYQEKLIGDPARGVIASGPIVTMMDMATSLAIWMKRGKFAPQATVDLRVDYLRPATPGRTVIGRGECLRVTRSIAFVRGIAYEDTPDDPIANVAGTFMLLDAAA